MNFTKLRVKTIVHKLVEVPKRHADELLEIDLCLRYSAPYDPFTESGNVLNELTNCKTLLTTVLNKLVHRRLYPRQRLKIELFIFCSKFPSLSFLLDKITKELVKVNIKLCLDKGGKVIENEASTGFFGKDRVFYFEQFGFQNKKFDIL